METLNKLLLMVILYFVIFFSVKHALVQSYVETDELCGGTHEVDN